MRRLVFALMSGLVFVPFPLHAQTVTLTVCNMGKVDIDVFVSPAGSAFSSNVRPATCAAVAQSSGVMQPAHVGLAFTDSRGQWGAARRFDGVPYMGVKNFPVAIRLAMSLRRETPPKVLTLATRSETVRRGNVSLPMQLLFQPSVPLCRAVPTGGGATVGGTTIVEVTNICEDLGYTLKVEAFPDSREIWLSSLPVSGEVSEDGPVRISEKTAVNWAEEEAERKAREEPVPVSWSDLLPVLRTTQNDTQRFRDVIPSYIVIRGTVSKVEVSPGENNSQVVNVAFGESPFVTLRPDWEPYSEFNVCTTSLDIFQDVFGANFRTSMIGQSIEVRGEPWSLGCRGLRGSMGITLARQVRPVPSAQFAAGTRFWVPPASALPPPGMTPEKMAALLAKDAADQEKRVACATEAAKTYPQSWMSDQAVGYQNAVRACLIASGLPAPPPAVDYRPPPPTPNAGTKAALPGPPPVVSTFSTAPTPSAGALSIANFTSQWVGKAVVATGTVARVATIRGFEHLYFQGAGSKLVVCFAQGFGGVKNASELIGKTIEVRARIDSPAGCSDHGLETVGATEIRQLNQLKLIGSPRP